MRNDRIIASVLTCCNLYAAYQPNYYDILNVPKTATTHDVHKAYRRLAKKIHPDRSLDEDAVYKFQELNNAYHTLIDHASRKEYDRSLMQDESDWGIDCQDCGCQDRILLFFIPYLKSSHAE